MQTVISATQMRAIDRLTVQKYSVPSLLLMESAANACLRTIAAAFPESLAQKRARVLCGPGNNGGDGAALARLLANVGVQTEVILFGKVENTNDDARTNFEIAKRLASFHAGSGTHPSRISFVECQDLGVWEALARPRKTYDIIIDALFGTGLTRPLEGIFLQVVQHLDLIRRARQRSSRARPLIVSIDIPSGLNADLATTIGEAVRADITITFTAPKPANVLPPASHLCGQLVVANIGSPASLVEGTESQLLVTEAADAREWLIRTRYAPESFKNTHGHVLVIAGSSGYTGAAALAGDAAMRSGAGLVTVATPTSVQTSVAAQSMAEVMTIALAETDRGTVSEEAIEHVMQLASKASVIAIGPGLSSVDERTRRFVREIVTRRVTPLIIDADGLNCLSPWPNELQGSTDLPLVLTPHPREMLRLIGETDKAVLSDRIAAARAFAVKNRLIVVLKGSRSLVASPDGRVIVNPTGNPGLGTAGAGDTLTGLIAGFSAQEYASQVEPDAVAATVAALYVGGLAGDLAAQELGMRTMVASDIRQHFGAAMLALDPEGERSRGLDKR